MCELGSRALDLIVAIALDVVLTCVELGTRALHLDSPQPIPADGILLELGSGRLEQVDATRASVSHG